jgi:hypothetical protein
MNGFKLKKNRCRGLFFSRRFYLAPFFFGKQLSDNFFGLLSDGTAASKRKQIEKNVRCVIRKSDLGYLTLRCFFEIKIKLYVSLKIRLDKLKLELCI